MRCWITLLVSLLEVGCSHCPSNTVDGPTASQVARATPNVLIRRFACMDLKNQLPGDPAPLQVSEKMRIDNWGRGGPGGANWNASDLLCSIEGTTTCAAGELVVSVWAGQKLAHRTSVKLPLEAGSFSVLTEILQAAWMDQRVDEKLGDQYETVTFRSTATLKCTEPYKAGPQDTLPEEHASHAFFVAGFAFGE